VARWLVAASLVATISGIWWAATITAEVKEINARADERFKAVDARFDRIEASIAKLIEQTKPTPRP
jgi:hypothetical protein